MDIPVFADQQKLTFISYFRTLSIVYNAYQARRPVETVGLRELNQSVLSACLNENDDVDVW